MIDLQKLLMVQNGFDVLSSSDLSNVDLKDFEFIIRDANNDSTDAYASIHKESIDFSFNDCSVYVDATEIEIVYSVYGENYEDDIEYILGIENPTHIVNEETFFQASTLQDLSEVPGHEWIVSIMQMYKNIIAKV